MSAANTAETVTKELNAASDEPEARAVPADWATTPGLRLIAPVLCSLPRLISTLGSASSLLGLHVLPINLLDGLLLATLLALTRWRLSCRCLCQCHDGMLSIRFHHYLSVAQILQKRCCKLHGIGCREAKAGEIPRCSDTGRDDR